MLDMPIEELDLPMRAYNSLKRNNIVKVGQLLQLKDEDLLRMRNFGKKSLDEMKERLRMRGFIVPRPSRRRPGRRYERDEATPVREARSLSMAHRIDGRKLGRRGPGSPVQEPDRLVLRYERSRPPRRRPRSPRQRRAHDHARQAGRLWRRAARWCRPCRTSRSS
jgi:hypothetical protein